MKRIAQLALGLVTLTVLAGCGGGSSDTSGTLREGVYEYELTEDYLRQSGIPAEQAANENGAHEVTLNAGRFIDRWRTGSGTLGSCWGTYAAAGNVVTFRFTGGCFGDWSMRFALDDDVVAWSDIKALPPHDGTEEQKVAEAFNGVPWTRIGDAR